MKQNIVLQKSSKFSVQIVNFVLNLQKEHKEFVISRQLLKSATSVGANITEANSSISRKEFLSKMYISLKEAQETDYWLKLILESQLNKYINLDEVKNLIEENGEIISLLMSITYTTRSRLIKIKKDL